MNAALADTTAERVRALPRLLPDCYRQVLLTPDRDLWTGERRCAAGRWHSRLSREFGWSAHRMVSRYGAGTSVTFKAQRTIIFRTCV